jgi:hypothetical protein
LTTPSDLSREELEKAAIDYLQSTQPFSNTVQVGDTIVSAAGKSGGKIVRVSSEFPNLALAMLRQQYLGAPEALLVGAEQVETKALLMQNKN